MKHFDPIPPSVALKVTRDIILITLFSIGLLLGIGYVDAKGEEIDKYMTTILK